jgi:GT2 family glycosyltransferase
MLLSVIILSYNTRELTLKCIGKVIESADWLKKETKIRSEILVLDNASSDVSAEEIRKNYPQVKLITQDENTGFARGNNVAMKAANGDWLLLLNSDAFVKKETLTQVFDYVQLHPEVDVLGSRLVNQDGSVQQSFGYFPTLQRVVALMFGVDNFPEVRKTYKSIHVRDVSRYAYPQEVDWVTGAEVFLKKAVWKRTGGFDEKYFMYGEEMEWMYRMKKKGFKIWYVPVGEVVHLGGASTKNLGKMFASELKGYLYWYKKHNSRLEAAILPMVLILGGIYKALIWWILGNGNQAKANWTAAVEVLKQTRKFNY